MPVSDFKQRGFTLVEISLVLAIVSIIFSAFIVGFDDFRARSHYGESELYLEEAQTALLNFALVQGYLPCPDSTGDGVQDVEASADGQVCTANSGALPWSDLGLERLTPWDVAAFYVVNQQVTADTCDSPDKSVCFFEDEQAPAFELTTTPPVAGNGGIGNLTVNNSAGNPVAQNVIAVIGITGQNFAATAADCASVSGDETENCDGDFTFVMDVHRSDTANFFDDQLIWIHANTLKGRLRGAGLL